MSTITHNLSLGRYSAEDRRLIEAAFAYATEKHAGVTRKSGEPYISHPLEVARYLADLGMDAQTVAAALLHDTIEDTDATYTELSKHFGETVSELVDGVTKLGQVDYDAETVAIARQAASIENIRKLLLAMSRDIRVVMIKLADRRHNLQTLDALKPEDRRRIARESLDIFAPLADRLGMGLLKAEIEDLAFAHSDPAARKLTAKLVAGNNQEALGYLEHLKGTIGGMLRESGVDYVAIDARQKHLYSIYRKLTKVEGDISKIYDLTALRIVVPDMATCYQVLGVLHQHFKPLIYRIKDYIAVPKPNGYRSLHTTVFADEGRIVEIQIRTQQMHDEAEYGLAAHAVYNMHKETQAYRQGQSATGTSKLKWVGELATITSAQTGPELWHDLQIDLFRDRIFVFSPRGDLYDLPEGATPVDFAFAVHSEVGLRAQGARVNGRISPLDKPLENRDVVEILTRKLAAPNRSWLTFVKTAQARNRIRHWLRTASRDTTIANGRQLLEPKLKAWGINKLSDLEPAALKRGLADLNYKDLDGLLAAIGEGGLASEHALRKLLPTQLSEPRPVVRKTPAATGRAVVTGAHDLPCHVASCCNPERPEDIVGYITRGSGITVHRLGCGNIPTEPDRLIDCHWEDGGGANNVISVTLEVTATNRIGLVRDVTAVVSGHHLNIVSITTYNQEGDDSNLEKINVVLEVEDLVALSYVITRLEQVTGVVNVIRQK